MKKEGNSWYVAQRGEFLAKEFLLELGAKSVASLEPVGVGIDYMAFFETAEEAVTVIAVEVKATERDFSKSMYVLPLKLVNRLQRINIPALIVVSNVKFNDIYFVWVQDIVVEQASTLLKDVRIRLRKADESEKESLRQEIFKHSARND